MSAEPADQRRPVYGDTWVYESLIGAVPGLAVAPRTAVALQFVLFEAGVLGLGLAYGLRDAILPGTVAVTLAAAGSIAMLRISRQARAADVPAAYRRVLFGSSIEVVLAVVSFVLLVTYLFVVDPRDAAEPLVVTLLGPDPPALVVALFLLVCWDVCYRIGTGWWASVVALWRTLRLDVPAPARARLVRADAETMGFAALQLALLPFLVGHPLLVGAVAGHVVAVTVVTGAAIGLSRRDQS
jgi:hypothetical protein